MPVCNIFYLSINSVRPMQPDLDNYKILVENVKDYAIFILDINGHITSWNKGAEKIKGYKEQEVIGRHSSIFYTKEDIEKKIPEKNLQTAKKLGQFEDEGWRVRKDGSLFWASVTFTALRDKNGNLTGFGKLTRDISRQRQNEDEIHSQNIGVDRRCDQEHGPDPKRPIGEKASPQRYQPTLGGKDHQCDQTCVSKIKDDSSS